MVDTEACRKLSLTVVSSAPLAKACVAWQHVNMFGSFEFSDEDPDIDMDALAAQYADSVFWSNATQPGQGDLFD